MQQQKPSSAISIFCAAAPFETRFLAQWEKHLTPLTQDRHIIVWSEQHIMPGMDRLQQINDHLEGAQVAVFLLSPDFFVSDECMALIEQALKGSARVIPLLLHPVDWKTSKLANLACLPANGQFVTTCDNQDHAFHICVEELRQLLGLPVVSHQTRKLAHEAVLLHQNRERMLRRLRRTYVDLMNQSLQRTAWLELDLAFKPDAVQNATNLLLRVESRPERHLPPGTSITQVYDEAEHELLILGEPGAGKSTLLLDLAEHLVVRTETDETHPLPVILPLSSWAIKRLPLQDWIAEQMSEIYDVPHKVGIQWVQEDRILPLLDGLDEMEQTARPACIAAINIYHRDHLAQLVVSSRITEYKAATEHHCLALQEAVVVQPLTHSDVEAYLVQAGQPLAALRGALKKNAALHDLATTPLMLNILILTYQGTSVRGLSKKKALLLQQVWDNYVQRMVERKGNSKRYPLVQTRSWLGWLARQVQDHSQAVFYLEHLQPDWLASEQRNAYGWLAIRLPAIFIGILICLLVHLFFSAPVSLLQSGIAGGLLGGLWSRSALEEGTLGWKSKPKGGRKSRRLKKPLHIWKKRLVEPLVISGCTGLIYGLSFGFDAWQIYGYSYAVMVGLSSLFLQYLLRAPIHSDIPSGTHTLQRWRRAVRFLQDAQGLNALLLAVVTSLGFGLLSWQNYLHGQQFIVLGEGNNTWIFALSAGLTDGLNIGLYLGLSYLLISLALRAQMKGIHLAERITWTRRSLSRGLFNSRHLLITLSLACGSTIFFGLSNGVNSGVMMGLIFGPLFGLNTGLMIALHFGLGTGISFGLLNGLSLGLIYWFLLGVPQGIAQEQIQDQDRRVTNQGIHHSVRNSVMMGIIGGGMLGVISILSNVLQDGLSYSSNEGLSYPLNVGVSFSLGNGLSTVWSVGLQAGISSLLLIWILAGGLAVWRHYIIRFLLWHSHTFPWKAPEFLNDATARFLLRRIGGGYSFSHRLLLDHMAIRYHPNSSSS